MRAHVASSVSAAVSRRETPMVTARTSRLSLSIMRSTSRTSEDSQSAICDSTSAPSYALERAHDVLVHDQALRPQRRDRAGEAAVELREGNLEVARGHDDAHREV